MKTETKLKRNRNLIFLVMVLMAIIFISPVQAQTKRDHRTTKVEVTKSTDAEVRDHRTKKESSEFNTDKESNKEESMEVQAAMAKKAVSEKTPETKEKATHMKAKIPDLGKFDDLLQPDIPILTNSVSQPELKKATNQEMRKMEKNK